MSSNQVEKIEINEISDNTCQGSSCSKKSTLCCPTCLKLNIKNSYFCSQECFKKNWNYHKLIHKSSKQLIFDPFSKYPYTGKLRAQYPLSPTRKVPEHIPRPDYATDGIPYSEKAARNRSYTKIETLTTDEIQIMRQVSRLAREVLNIGASALKEGVTPDDIDSIIHDACIERDSYPSPLNYFNFPKSCCISVNEVICHGIPDKRPFQDGDIVNLDITLYHKGFHADLNETYTIGNVDETGLKLIECAKTCLDKAIMSVKPGMAYRDLGEIIEQHANSQGFSVVRSYCGHGVHKLFHCAPDVPHYARNKTVGIMKPGHVFTIEPMISEGTWKDALWPDNWTVVTADGKRSAQFEETLLVTETGVEILTENKCAK